MWSDGSTNQILTATTAGTYSVTGTDANGCTAVDSMVIDILTVDIAQNDTTICEGDSISLNVEYGSLDYQNSDFTPISSFEYQGCFEGSYYYFS